MRSFIAACVAAGIGLALGACSSGPDADAAKAGAVEETVGAEAVPLRTEPGYARWYADPTKPGPSDPSLILH